MLFNSLAPFSVSRALQAHSRFKTGPGEKKLLPSFNVNKKKIKVFFCKKDENKASIPLFSNFGKNKSKHNFAILLSAFPGPSLGTLT